MLYQLRPGWIATFASDDQRFDRTNIQHARHCCKVSNPRSNADIWQVINIGNWKSRAWKKASIFSGHREKSDGTLLGTNVGGVPKPIDVLRCCFGHPGLFESNPPQQNNPYALATRRNAIPRAILRVLADGTSDGTWKNWRSACIQAVLFPTRTEKL